MGILTLDDAPGRRNPNAPTRTTRDGPVKKMDTETPPKSITRPSPRKEPGQTPRFAQPGETKRLK